MASYWQHCRDCGHRIQLREMPQGQWVAFDAYDRVHRCPGTRQQRHTQPSSAHPSSVSTATTTPKNVDPEVVRLLRQYRRLHIRYCDVSGRVTERDIRVVEMGDEGVHAFCELRGAPRFFTFEGILAAQPRSESSVSGRDRGNVLHSSDQAVPQSWWTLIIIAVAIVLLWRLLNQP